MSRQPKKGGKVQPIGNVAVEEPPNPSPQQQTPPRKGKRDPIPAQATFFQRIARVNKADWGTRASIKAYRLEPIIDRLRGSENKYITIYQEPITEEKLKIDHGSGRYRLYFTFKEPAGQDKEIDSVELDVMDMNFPPKVPPGEWVDDGRNKKWAWAKPAGAPGGPAIPTQAPLETAYETVLDIQDRERQRNGEKATDINQFTSMVSAVKSILPTAPAATDNTMLTTIVTLLTAQINSTQQEAAQLRKQVFDLITAKQNENTGIEALIEKADSWMPKLKGLLNLGGDKLTEVVHGRPRPWWQDLALQVVPPVVQSFAPVIPMMIDRMGRPAVNGNGMNGMNGAAPQQQALPQGQQPQQPPNQMQQLQIKVGNFLGANIKPLQKHFEDYRAGKLIDPDDPDSKIDGEDFAAWVVEYHGADILKDARALGSAQIMQMFRQSMYWPAIQPHEAKLAEFLDQVLSYSPEPEQENEEGTIDLSQGEEA
jgi:hypothetical protein